MKLTSLHPCLCTSTFKTLHNMLRMRYRNTIKALWIHQQTFQPTPILKTDKTRIDIIKCLCRGLKWYKFLLSCDDQAITKELPLIIKKTKGHQALLRSLPLHLQSQISAISSMIIPTTITIMGVQRWMEAPATIQASLLERWVEHFKRTVSEVLDRERYL